MTFSRTSDTSTTSVCDSCGDYITSPFGLVVQRFERERVCERRVA